MSEGAPELVYRTITFKQAEGAVFLLLTSHKGSENSEPDRENIVRIRPRLNQQAN